MTDKEKVETLPPTTTANCLTSESLSSLVVKVGYQTRAGMDAEVIAEYAEAIRQAGR